MQYKGRERLLGSSMGSIYKLVILASKRALEIAEGQPKLVDDDASVKPSTVALHEIEAGKVEARKIKAKE
ncbi:MAG TPA: DNA-directed RNA polymerase subunit omega [Candidatus Omnitrophota bacterium]|nr:DNA-directed RNA polymerase subunit omega [Candidatus Omnitrophota bacterium]HPT39777.1 DNA-directed RNA polymerase subunit omega [Candidatus Omnitrophota bacterium]